MTVQIARSITHKNAQGKKQSGVGLLLPSRQVVIISWVIATILEWHWQSVEVFIVYILFLSHSAINSNIIYNSSMVLFDGSEIPNISLLCVQFWVRQLF